MAIISAVFIAPNAAAIRTATASTARNIAIKLLTATIYAL